VPLGVERLTYAGINLAMFYLRPYANRIMARLLFVTLLPFTGKFAWARLALVIRRPSTW
jgi:NADH:ubiquinone oxidoreductase subunit H